MYVDFFGNAVRCETDGLMVSLNDLINAGNAWRLQNGKAAYQMAAFLASTTLRDYIAAVAVEWGLPAESFVVRTGTGKSTRTMVHISVAILAAEQISPAFHARVHRTFVEGKLLEFRDQGGTEFKALNAALSYASQQILGEDAHKGHFVQLAEIIRGRVLGESDDWSTAKVSQTHRRYAIERDLVKVISLGLVRDWEHLQSLAAAV